MVKKEIKELEEKKIKLDLIVSTTSMDIDSPQASDGVDISQKRKNFRSKLLILSNSADSLSSNQIDEYESMLADIENGQNQLRSKQYCTTARVIPNKLQEAKNASNGRDTTMRGLGTTTRPAGGQG
uniref:Uncharacterized protein n=1 Tax=Romanomermis culicivorax TaxID=13658 RepID=A0A915HPA2_ROMCU